MRVWLLSRRFKDMDYGEPIAAFDIEYEANETRKEWQCKEKKAETGATIEITEIELNHECPFED